MPRIKNRPKRPYKAADPCHKVRGHASAGNAGREAEIAAIGAPNGPILTFVSFLGPPSGMSCGFGSVSAKSGPG